MRTIRDEDECDGTVSIADVKCIHATASAILCIIDGDQKWIPQSQVHADSEVYEVGGKGTLVVTAWFANKAGLGD